MVEEATAGFVFPKVWLKQHGVDETSTYLCEQFISGSYDSVIAWYGTERQGGF